MQDRAAGLDPAWDRLRATWQRQYEVRERRLAQTLGSATIPKVAVSGEPFVTAVVQFMAERRDVATTWDKLVPDRRTRLGQRWSDLGEEIVRKFAASQPSVATNAADGPAAPPPRRTPWDVVEGWLLNGSTFPDAYREVWMEFKAWLREAARDRWDETRLRRVNDSIDLTIRRPDGSVAGSLQGGGLSDGQRNTAVLALLLADGDGPVVVDQPEDELDAAFIYDQLVPMLRAVKDRRQIIFVTHNANLPVNGDAELVYALDARDGRGQRRAEGGLDRAEVGDAVLDIMEGSREAFRRRRAKYGF